MNYSKSFFKKLFILIFCSIFMAQHLYADNSTSENEKIITETQGSLFITPDWLSLHGQFTDVVQYHPGFTAPYAGINSMGGSKSTKTTNDATLYFGLRILDGTELFFNPEIDQGYGLTDTVGMAGFPSGEAYKIGKGSPYYKVPRYFVRQTFNLGGETAKIEDDINQTAGNLSADNLIVTLGKFSVVDIFDTNIYAHDPKSDFLNWSILEGGAFDYAADSWGYTYGGAAELTKEWWAARVGVFALSTEPNTQTLDNGFHQYETVVELEERHKFFDQAGKFKVLVFANHANMGSYSDAIADMGNNAPSTASVRRYQTRTGLVLNAEQAINGNIGWFGRMSMNDGSKEAYDFTDINRSYSTGLVCDGKLWSRPDDKFGVAIVVNQLSSVAQQYFELGGAGILIGDAAHPGYASEDVFEAFYSAQIEKHTTVTLDYQFANNPAYNPARGPINILGLRFHAEF